MSGSLLLGKIRGRFGSHLLPTSAFRLPTSGFFAGLRSESFGKAKWGVETRKSEVKAMGKRRAADTAAPTTGGSLATVAE